MRDKRHHSDRRRAAEELRSDLLLVLPQTDTQAEDEAWEAFCRSDPFAVPVLAEVRMEAPATTKVPAVVEAGALALGPAPTPAPILVGPPPPPPGAVAQPALMPAVEAPRPIRPVGGDAREAAVLFRRSAVAAARKEPSDPEARADLRQSAMALLQLATLDEEELLASHLRPDPAKGASTWTVACYQIGDLSPTSLRDFPESAAAVLHLADCETRAHVAAELIAATGDGVRWTALVRSGAEIRFQPFGAATVTADTPELVLAAGGNWDHEILRWETDPAIDLVVAGQAPAAPAPAPSQRSERGEVGVAVGQILEAVRRIEGRMAADDALARRIAELECAQRSASAEVEALRAEVARLIASDSRRGDPEGEDVQADEGAQEGQSVQVRPGGRRWLVAGAILAAVGALAGCSSASKTKGASLSVFHLRTGQCAITPQAVKAQLSNLSVVSCHQPHTQEVFALVADNAGSNYPGATALQSFANGACLQHFAGYVGVDYRDSSLFYTYLLPSVRSWSQGDRTVDCLVTTTGQTLTKSVKGARI